MKITQTLSIDYKVLYVVPSNKINQLNTQFISHKTATQFLIYKKSRSSNKKNIKKFIFRILIRNIVFSA